MTSWDQTRRTVSETAAKFLEKADSFPDDATASKSLMARQAATLYDLVEGEGTPIAILTAVLDLSIAQLHAITDLEGRLITIERHIEGPDVGTDPVE